MACHQELAKSVSTKTGLDIALVLQLLTQYGPVFVSLLKTLIEAWKDQPVYASATPATGECDPALKEALEAACKASCATCCAVHHSMCVANCCDN
jgi:hypothetical protein